MSDESTPQHPLVRKLNTLAESSIYVVPVCCLVLAIGAAQLFPVQPSPPNLFNSREEAERFASKYRLPIVADEPLILSKEGCEPCKELTSQLRNAGISFHEEMVAMGSPGESLFNRTSRASYSSELPQVVLHWKVVKPNIKAIERELLSGHWD